MTETEAFETALDHSDDQVYVVTAADGSTRAGCLVGFACQASITPPRFLVMLSKANMTYRVARRSVVLIVHIVRDDAEGRRIASLFAEETGDEIDKFAEIDFVDGDGGSPVIAGLDWFAGRLLQSFDCGDHRAFLLAPHNGEMLRTATRPLGYQDVKDLEPGHPA